MFSDLIDVATEGELYGAYGHSKEYWNGEENLQAEAFAHFFEALMGEGKRDFLQNFFLQHLECLTVCLENMIASQKEFVLERTYYGR